MVCKHAVPGSVWSRSIYNNLGWQYSGQSVGKGWPSYSAEFGDNEIDGIMFKISGID